MYHSWIVRSKILRSGQGQVNVSTVLGLGQTAYRGFMDGTLSTSSLRSTKGFDDLESWLARVATNRSELLIGKRRRVAHKIQLLLMFLRMTNAQPSHR